MHSIIFLLLYFQGSASLLFWRKKRALWSPSEPLCLRHKATGAHMGQFVYEIAALRHIEQMNIAQSTIAE
jgi:hypothetical protein